jgi:mannose-6-phosphate isomerase-like protein (cupin superfamily)
MALIEKRTRNEVFKKERGWGYELWLDNLPEYCAKILHLEAGKRGSSHFHLNKTETMLLVWGKVDIEFIDPTSGQKYTAHLFPGDSVLIPRGQVHQIIALGQSEIVEFSTTHEETDSYRVQKGD